ncbi:MAG: S9 family peptidase [Pirellulaceae bacterium]
MPSRSRPSRIAYLVALCWISMAAVLGSDLPAAEVAKPGDTGPSADPIAPHLVSVPLIPREKLFGNPDRTAARISPSGKWLAWLAPDQGVLNIWIAPMDDIAKSRVVTKDRKRGIRNYSWTYDGNLVYVQDVEGNEDWHVCRVDLEENRVTDLTPLENVRAEIEAVSHRIPDKILVGLNDRNPALHDLYAVDLATAERTLLVKNTENLTGYIVDEDYRVRFATKMSDDGGSLILKPAKDEDDSGPPSRWDVFIKIPLEDTLNTRTVGFDKSGDVLYLIDSRERDTGALTTLDLETGKQQVVAANEQADIGGIMIHPTENTIQAASYDYLNKEWIFLDPAVRDDFGVLRKVAQGEIIIASRTLDDRQWIIGYLRDVGPLRYYHFDRDTGTARFLFTSRSDLEGLPLVKMHGVVIPARDDVSLVSYYTLPQGTDEDGDGRPSRPLPLVLNVHGGPWARDAWGFDPLHQFWANRGYAVLSVNFRGSVGFGKRFVNLGNKQWSAAMHDDLVDAVRWAVREKIAIEDKVAITGGSYGGYATLVGLTFTPELFACGVDIVGPSNLVTLLETIPPYWKPAMELFRRRVGDHTTEEGRKYLRSISPLTYADRIVRPLLIAQGANDPRVKQAESDQIVQAMQERNIPVTYVLFPDEGHGFARPENRLAFYAVAEHFVAHCLGGRAEDYGDAFADSSLTVPAGVQFVPGLKSALDENEPVAAGEHAKAPVAP